MGSASTALEERLAQRQRGWLDIRSGLNDFALINYAVPAERLRPHIPTERFDIPEFSIGGRSLAMLSVVPFLDAGFRFRLLPFVRFEFCQTNFRVYVIDRKTGEHVVWFFGTTLSSWTVWPARWLWKIPWYRARYARDCRYSEEQRRYEAFHYRFQSQWCDGRIDVADSGKPVDLVAGFVDRDQMMLVLTHPVDGFFYRLDGAVGTYGVWHELLDITTAEPVDLYFSLFERLAVMSPDEMQAPHSVFLCRRTVFDIHMPPRKARR